MTFASDVEKRPPNHLEISYGTYRKDPYNISGIFFSVLQSDGFPIRLKMLPEEINDEDKLVPEEIEVLTDSKETVQKIKQIKSLTGTSKIYHWLEAVDQGDPGNLTLSARQNSTLAQCFLQAYERRLKFMEENPDHPDPCAPINLEEKLFEEKLYKNLLKKGIRPIDPESMGLILIPVIDDILRKHPELTP